MADRYVVMGQIFIENGTGVITEVGRHVADATLNVTTPGTFTFYMASGTTAVVSSGTAAVTDSPKTLSAGSNSVEVLEAGNIDFNITIGTAANTNDVNSWSATSGGACTASVPTSTDNSYSDVNSFTAVSQILTVEATAYCLSMDWTGAVNSPTLAGSSNIRFSGNITFILGMVSTHSGSLQAAAVAGIQLLTTNGLSLTSTIYRWEAGTLQLQDDLTTTRGVIVNLGTINTNGKTVTCTSFTDNGSSGVKIVTLGASIINCTSWSFPSGGLTLTANTATINVSVFGVFAGGGIATYYILNLIGTAHTVSGNNTFAQLNLVSGTTQTITFTAGSIQTVTTANLSGDATHLHTLTGTGSWRIVKTGGGTVQARYVTVVNSYASPCYTFYAIPPSTRGVGNSRWSFGYPGFKKYLLEKIPESVIPT